MLPLRLFLLHLLIVHGNCKNITKRKLSLRMLLIRLSILIHSFLFTGQFGIFSVIQFPNVECTTREDTSVKGVCMSAEDCGNKGGTDDGNCAAGFGVCCRFT